MSARRLVAAQRGMIEQVTPLSALRASSQHTAQYTDTVAEQAEAEQADLEQADAAHITWGALGCPDEPGLYRAVHDGVPSDLEIQVKLIHILAAEDDPDAVFTVIEVCLLFGPLQFALGHRVI